MEVEHDDKKSGTLSSLDSGRLCTSVPQQSAVLIDPNPVDESPLDTDAECSHVSSETDTASEVIEEIASSTLIHSLQKNKSPSSTDTASENLSPQSETDTASETLAIEHIAYSNSSLHAKLKSSSTDTAESIFSTQLSTVTASEGIKQTINAR